MVGEMVKKQCRARHYISCNYSCTLYFLVKHLFVKLKKLHTSACLKLNYCTTKQTKNVKVAKMVEFIKTCTSDTFVNFVNFFNSTILSLPFLLRKKYLQKMLFMKNQRFPSAWGIMIKTWGSVLLGGISKNEQVQFFD